MKAWFFADDGAKAPPHFRLKRDSDAWIAGTSAGTPLTTLAFRPWSPRSGLPCTCETGHPLIMSTCQMNSPSAHAELRHPCPPIHAHHSRPLPPTEVPGGMGRGRPAFEMWDTSGVRSENSGVLA